MRCDTHTIICMTSFFVFISFHHIIFLNLKILCFLLVVQIIIQVTFLTRYYYYYYYRCEVSTFQLRFFTHKFELIILLKGSYSRFTQMNVKLMLLSLWGHKIKLEHTPTTTKDVLLC